VRQAVIVYGLILAVLLAALVMSYLGFRHYMEVGETARAKDYERMKELAVEKVIGLQDNIVRADLAMFEALDGAERGDLPRRMPELLEKSTLQSVMVLDLDMKVVAGGFYTKRLDDRETPDVDETQAFKDLFEQKVVPDLELGKLAIGERRHLHKSYDGLPYLFAYSRRFIDGKMVYVVVEADLGYLIAAVSRASSTSSRTTSTRSSTSAASCATATASRPRTTPRCRSPTRCRAGSCGSGRAIRCRRRDAPPASSRSRSRCS
jgi:hypothetical protein